MKRYPITPIGKPRMTQSDKWKKRPIVERYNKFKDICRLYKITIPKMYAHIMFVVPMPEHWSDKKKSEMCDRPHEQRPDVDNMLKALMDAVFKDDSCISYITIEKVWGYEGAIIIK